MNISLEVSLYPLDERYLTIIEDIVEKINAEESVQSITNTMSTQVFGPIDDVMKLLNDIVKYSFATYGKQVFVAKFVNSDLNPHQN